jgi:hypothetical protein
MKKFTLFLFASVLLASCSSISVVSDVDKTVDFTQFKTLTYHGWADNSDKLLTDLDKRRIENAFQDEFAKRGVTVVKEGGDIIVALYIVTEQKTETTANTTNMGGMYGGYGYGGYYGYGPGWGYGAGMSTTTYSEHDYTVGTLAVSVYNPKTEKLIWEGVGKGTLKENPKGREERVNEAAKKIMYSYPVKPTATKK